MGHRAKDRGSMGRRAMAAAIIYRQMLPSSAFFALFPRYLRNPGPSSLFEAVRSGFQILGLLIYTYETKQSRLKITGVFGDLRGKMCTEKRGVRNAVVFGDSLVSPQTGVSPQCRGRHCRALGVLGPARLI